MRPTGLRLILLIAITSAIAACSVPPVPVQQRNEVSYRRGPYNFDFWRRHEDPYRFGAAIHKAHAKAHDVPQLTPLDRAERVDEAFDAEMVHAAYDPPRIEPHMTYWGPHTSQFAWDLYRAIDWTHMHHEQTYDVMSSQQVPWERKKELTDRTVDYYLRWVDVARSPAPLDVTMRRAGVMMKPYFPYFRMHYPESAKYFYVAHWWHPAIYEAMMIGGNDAEQEQAVSATHALTYEQVFHDRPLRMLLSREMMPRYSRMSPESANIFDNLHMLHGIAYSILSYDGWTAAEKRAELYRVIDAMAEQPGDRELARLFPIPRPDMDPRVYEDWMRGVRGPEGSMNQIMEEMLREMWPHMSADGSAEPPPEVWEQFWMKLEPGMQEGEAEGSLHDAIMSVYPDMKMNPESMKPGVAPQKMIDAMLQGWREKHGDMQPVEPLPMDTDPSLPPEPATASEQAARATPATPVAHFSATSSGRS